MCIIYETYMVCNWQHYTFDCTVGSSDFHRSLGFKWFWVPIEILRQVYKLNIFWKVECFLSYLTFYCILQKSTTAHYKSRKCVIKRSTLMNWFQKGVELLQQEVPQKYSLKSLSVCDTFLLPAFSTRIINLFEQHEWSDAR